jgi:hypothetical protein
MMYTWYALIVDSAGRSFAALRMTIVGDQDVGRLRPRLQPTARVGTEFE